MQKLLKLASCSANKSLNERHQQQQWTKIDQKRPQTFGPGDLQKIIMIFQITGGHGPEFDSY